MGIDIHLINKRKRDVIKRPCQKGINMILSTKNIIHEILSQTGVVGLEPTNAGIKIRCVYHFTIPQ